MPLNYAEPNGAQIDVTVTRAPATGQRTGPLFVYPGGPGGSAKGFVLGMRDRGPAALREQFDLVGVEWRGTGASDFECGVGYSELYSVDPTIEGPDDRVALLDVSLRYVDGCAAQAGDLLEFIGSDEAARDLDAVRAAMGDEQLSFFGISYGSLLGQMYAELFPQRLRAMVIDGITEPGSTGLDAATTQSLGFERMLDLTVEGNHHSSAAGGSDCASDHAANYLLSVTPPPRRHRLPRRIDETVTVVGVVPPQVSQFRGWGRVTR